MDHIFSRKSTELVKRTSGHEHNNCDSINSGSSGDRYHRDIIKELWILRENFNFIGAIEMICNFKIFDFLNFDLFQWKCLALGNLITSIYVNYYSLEHYQNLSNIALTTINDDASTVRKQQVLAQSRLYKVGSHVLGRLIRHSLDRRTRLELGRRLAVTPPR